MDPDFALLDRWQTGEREAGEALFERHFADVYRFFEHKVGGDADDLAQRTFLACVSSVERFRRQSSFRTYLFAIARHELYGHLRRLPPGGDADFELTSIAAIVTSAGTRLARAHEAEQLRAALAELPGEQQLLLELHYWHELDAAQLAEVFDATAGAVRVRLLRARRALRERLAARGDTPIDAGDRLARSLSEPEPDDDA